MTLATLLIILRPKATYHNRSGRFGAKTTFREATMKHNLLYLLFILLFALVACGSQSTISDTAENDSAQFSDDFDDEGDFEDEDDFNGEDDFDNEDDFGDEEDVDEEGDDFDDEEGDDKSTENHAVAPIGDTPYLDNVKLDLL